MEKLIVILAIAALGSIATALDSVNGAPAVPGSTTSQPAVIPNVDGRMRPESTEPTDVSADAMTQKNTHSDVTSGAIDTRQVTTNPAKKDDTTYTGNSVARRQKAKKTKASEGDSYEKKY